MSVYRKIYSTLLSRIDPETSHDIALRLLSLSGASRVTRTLSSRIFCLHDARLRIRVLDLEFPNPLGMAAGFDKNGVAVSGLAGLGFGHIEVGTVTPQPQPGNPKPRVFRLVGEGGLINRLGFPNVGADQVQRNLAKQSRPRGVIIGVNIGKGSTTPLEAANEDYVRCLSSFYEYADYLTINVSSPNTPELRTLQRKDLLTSLIRSIVAAGKELSRKLECRVKPLLLKISPDLDLYQLDEVLDVAVNNGLGGIVATNTTISRNGLVSAQRLESGGLSGHPLREASTRVIRRIYSRVGNELAIIGVGGIFSSEDAWEKLVAGASLVQAYTGFVYEGLAFAKKVNQGLLRIMERNGVKTIGEIVGTASASLNNRHR